MDKGAARMNKEAVRVLVINDDEAIHDSLGRILDGRGYTADKALSGAQGLAMMSEKDYGAVIVDLLMPEMDGLEVLEEMRKRGLTVPALMTTSYPTIKSAVRALRLGAVDYIPKPFTGKEILGPLSRALSRGECAWGACEIEHETPPSFKPGRRFSLPKHSWARLNEDGTVEVGLQKSFLDHLSSIRKIRGVETDDLVEQGHPGLILIAPDQVHRVFMPLTGRVVELNQEALDRPADLTPETWLVRIIPHDLEEELANLRPDED